MSLSLAITEIKAAIEAITGLSENTDKSALRDGSLENASNSSGKFDGSFIVAVDKSASMYEVALREEWHTADVRVEVGGRIVSEGRTAKSIELHTFATKIRQALVRLNGVGDGVKGILYSDDPFFSFDEDKNLVLQMGFVLYYYEDVT